MTRSGRALAVTLALGCVGPSATIRRPNGPPIEAEIASSDTSKLQLRGPNGNLIPLGQYQVSEIDHPGNVLALIGLGYTAVGILMLIPALTVDHRNSNGFEGAVGAMGVLAIAMGAPVLIYNGIVWAQSKSRARAFEDARPPDWLIPPPAAGEPEPIEPLRLPDGKDTEDPDKTPPRGFSR